MSDARKQYRATGAADAEIRLFLSHPGEEPVPCRIIDASVGGIAVQVSFGNPIDLDVDEAAWFRIEMPELTEPLVTPGVVRRKSVVDGGLAYGFSFLDWLGFLAKCPPDLRTIFNQRADLRVPFPPRYIGLTMHVDEPISGWINDLSPYGLSFEVKSAEVYPIARGDRATVEFELPCAGGRMAFEVVVLHASWRNGTLRCGACFDMKATRDFAAQCEIVEKYVATRLRSESANAAT